MRELKTIKEKVKKIKNTYKLECLEVKDLNCISNFIPFTTSEESLFFVDRGSRIGDSYPQGKIIGIDLGGIECKKNILSNIEHFLLIPLCYIKEEKALIYTEKAGEKKTQLKKISIETLKDEKLFSTGLVEHFLYPISIKYFDSALFIVDFFKHKIKKFSLSGNLLQEIETWDGFEFPREIVKYDEDNVIIVFDQDIRRKFQTKYSKGKKLYPTSFAKWNHKKNEIESIESDIDLDRYNDVIYSIIKTMKSEYFATTATGMLYKLDSAFNMIFKINFQRFIMKELGVSIAHIGGLDAYQEVINLSYYQDKMFAIFPSLKKVAIFNV